MNLFAGGLSYVIYRVVKSTHKTASTTPVEIIPKSNVTIAVQAWLSSSLNSLRVSALKELV